MIKAFTQLIQMSFLPLTLLLTTNAISQQNSDSIVLKEVSVIVENNEHEMYHGYLQSATDSFLTISSIRSSLLRDSNVKGRVNKYDFNATQINRISVQRKNRKIIGALIGLGAGTLIGILVSPKEPKTTPSDNIVGAIVNSFADATEYAIKKAMTVGLCGMAGGTIGAIAAPGSYKRILINGRYEDFKEFINTHKNYDL